MRTKENAGPFIFFSCNHLFRRRHTIREKKLEYFAYMAFKIVHLIRKRISDPVAVLNSMALGLISRPPY